MLSNRHKRRGTLHCKTHTAVSNCLVFLVVITVLDGVWVLVILTVPFLKKENIS